MTRRERMEQRQERREAWAQKREISALGTSDQAHTMADAIPFGQPILVGHYSEKPDRNYRALNALKAAGFRWAGGSWHGRADAVPADLRETA